jgi:enoyl-CoA hydratase/carnithine racemase
MISVSDNGAVRSLLLDRPEALNAFNSRMFDELTDALLLAADDDSVKVVVITGAGRAFSAGLDLSSVNAEAPAPKHGFPGLYEALLEFPKPILLAINGLGIGVGCTICGLVDMVFMAKSARLRCPFSALGLTAEAGSTITFPALLGHQAAELGTYEL